MTSGGILRIVRATYLLANLSSDRRNSWQMTGSGNATEPPNTGYEGWAVIDLEAQTVIHLNQRAHVLLGNKHYDLPAKLSTFLTATDLALLTDRALPAVMGGVPWQGGLRVGEHPVDMAPSPTMLVPHIPLTLPIHQCLHRYSSRRPAPTISQCMFSTRSRVYQPGRHCCHV